MTPISSPMLDSMKRADRCGSQLSNCVAQCARNNYCNQPAQHMCCAAITRMIVANSQCNSQSHLLLATPGTRWRHIVAAACDRRGGIATARALATGVCAEVAAQHPLSVAHTKGTLQASLNSEWGREQLIMRLHVPTTA